jgi:ABC-type sulfate/molybdate transport systems ATPase subunit
MLLAVARSGNGSSLFLLDEIDAALDEHNQARASALLRQLSHATDGSGCQILCVTHNAAFQSVCDAFVQVVRGPNGSSMPAAAADAVPDGGRDSSTAESKKGKGRAALKGKQAGSSSSKARTGDAAALQQGTTSRGSGSRSAKKVRFQHS